MKTFHSCEECEGEMTEDEELIKKQCKVTEFRKTPRGH